MDLTNDLKLLVEGIRSFRSLSDTKEEKKEKRSFKSLLGEGNDDPRRRMKVVFSLFKIPAMGDGLYPKSLRIRVPIPHRFVDDQTDILLITRDAVGHKGLRKDEQVSIHKYQDLLREHNALDLVTRVMPLKQLKTEYRDYEGKISLCRQFSMVFCDKVVYERMPLFLGGRFYQQGKIPIPVDLSKKDIRSELAKQLDSIHLHMDLRGDAAQAHFGCYGQTDKELAENLMAFIKGISDRIPGKWANVRSMHIKTGTSKAMPVYISLQSPNEVEEYSHPLGKKKRGPVQGFVDSIGSLVTVFPDLSVATREEKSTWSKSRGVFIEGVREGDVTLRKTARGRKHLPYIGNVVHGRFVERKSKEKMADLETPVEIEMKDEQIQLKKQLNKRRRVRKVKRIIELSAGKQLKSNIGVLKKKKGLNAGNQLKNDIGVLKKKKGLGLNAGKQLKSDIGVFKKKKLLSAGKQLKSDIGVLKKKKPLSAGKQLKSEIGVLKKKKPLSAGKQLKSDIGGFEKKRSRRGKNKIKV